MPDDVVATTPRRDPETGLYRVSKRIPRRPGQHRSAPHSDRSGKVGQAWNTNEVEVVLPASDRFTGELIAVYKLGEPAPCKECGVIPGYGNGGRLACECTVWNEGIPRPTSAPKPKPDVIKARQWRKFGKRGC